MEDNGCPVCSSNHSQCSWVGGKDVLAINCAQCGKFFLTGSAVPMAQLAKKKDKMIVSAYLREKELKGFPPPTIYTGAVSTQDSSEKGARIGWDSIVSQEYPKTISERLDRTLSNLSRMAPVAKWIPALAGENLAVAFAEDSDSWRYIIDQLTADRLIEELHSKQPGEAPLGVLRLTPKGWNRVADIEKGTAALQYKQAFVAMWFDDSMDKAWESGFRPGIEEGTGVRPVRVDLQEHNEKICDVIISEIRKSSFLVADFTGNRGGVYFEAGFAKGLGIPVIFTCQSGKWEKKLHFDTRQYNHIIWENTEDLKFKLQNRIKATIPRVIKQQGDR